MTLVTDICIAVRSSNALITDERLHSLDCQVATAEAASVQINVGDRIVSWKIACV